MTASKSRVNPQSRARFEAIESRPELSIAGDGHAHAPSPVHDVQLRLELALAQREESHERWSLRTRMAIYVAGGLACWAIVIGGALMVGR